ncbi:replication enhancer [Tomato leaf curl Sinaloa virus]|uniref:Replication enhancer n=2 Tax=Tomato leaf curl Sinaloa virus TaxID=71186 RepID=Q5TJJ6_9GEMI|nr:replication enhancer [Tomato leaf curl Sinaloa virus]AEW22954.1 replication enhancer protein [Tomato leaf curl Sinaloa virus]AEW22963.1 replication enhancer protein [Tomato leaf curl Sinaloa virus]ATI96904.1 replication enhancer protein [Tomato leaf curl Sinaloa virus]ATI96909.1 replication enhancer protein [Tomato leaf curl Sinaloa virus]AZA04946.1 replication enhancer protein [Tomato leaf curl Sinaloa virus]
MDSRTGALITAPQAENGVYIWEIENPLYFKMYREEDIVYTRTRVYHVQIRFNHNLRRVLHLHKAYLNFQIWTTLITASGSNYLARFRHLVNMYLDQLGVISINNVIRAVRFATDRSYVNYVLEDHSIKIKLY